MTTVPLPRNKVLIKRSPGKAANIKEKFTFMMVLTWRDKSLTCFYGCLKGPFSCQRTSTDLTLLNLVTLIALRTVHLFNYMILCLKRSAHLNYRPLVKLWNVMFSVVSVRQSVILYRVMASSVKGPAPSSPNMAKFPPPEHGPTPPPRNMHPPWTGPCFQACFNFFQLGQYLTRTPSTPCLDLFKPWSIYSQLAIAPCRKITSFCLKRACQ